VDKASKRVIVHRRSHKKVEPMSAKARGLAWDLRMERMVERLTDERDGLIRVIEHGGREIDDEYS